MGGFFSLGSGDAKKVTARDRAILDLKVQRDKLKQYHKKLNGVIARETAVAKQLLAQGRRDRALLALKKKKYQENLLEKSEGQLLTIEKMVESIEFAEMELEVFKRLKEGNAVLNEIHSQMTLEDVEKLMLDTEDALAYQREVEDMLAQNEFTAEDEEDIMAELEEIISQGSLEGMPVVPTQEPQPTEPPVKSPEAKKTPAAKPQAEKRMVEAS